MTHWRKEEEPNLINLSIALLPRRLAAIPFYSVWHGKCARTIIVPYAVISADGAQHID